MFRFNFDFEETVQSTPMDYRQQEKARITPCEDRNGIVSVTLAADRPEPPEAELKAFQYDEKRLTRYFISELCNVYRERTEQVATELARGMIERGSYLAPHEHLKYLEYERQENRP